jgi:hypothetical protein
VVVVVVVVVAAASAAEGSSYTDGLYLVLGRISQSRCLVPCRSML